MRRARVQRHEVPVKWRQLIPGAPQPSDEEGDALAAAWRLSRACPCGGAECIWISSHPLHREAFSGSGKPVKELTGRRILMRCGAEVVEDLDGTPLVFRTGLTGGPDLQRAYAYASWLQRIP